MDEFSIKQKAKAYDILVSALKKSINRADSKIQYDISHDCVGDSTEYWQEKKNTLDKVLKYAESAAMI